MLANVVTKFLLCISKYFKLRQTKQSMTWQNELLHVFQSKLLIKRAGQGAGLALLLVSLFLVIISKAHLEPWMLVSVSIVTIAGAISGASYYIQMELFRNWATWFRVLLNRLGVLVYLVVLFLSLVYALSLTGHWN